MGLGAEVLPLQAATLHGGQVDGCDIAVTVIDSRESGQAIQARVGVFFTELIGGCSCGDDPHTVPAYCVLQVTIDKQTGDAGFEVVGEVEHSGI